MKYLKIISINLLAALIVSLPTLIFAAGIQPPCDDGWNCKVSDAISYVKDILHFIVFTLGLPVAVALIIYAGVLYLVTGVANTKGQAKKILEAVMWGLVIMFGSYTLINYILKFLLKDTFLKTPEVV